MTTGPSSRSPTADRRRGDGDLGARHPGDGADVTGSSPEEASPHRQALEARPARATQPSTKVDLSTLSAEELERRALDLGQRSNRGRAIELLEMALKLEPKRARLHRLVGVLYRETGRLAKAERSFRKATRLDPKDAVAWADLAAILERAGSQNEALKSADRAVALAPKDAGMRADRAIIRYRLGQIDAAIDDGVAALAVLTDAPRLELDVALMRLTRGKRADVTAALAMLTKARAALPDDPAVALAHAQALMVAGRTKPAIQAYDALLARNNRQAWANWGRGLLAYRERHFDRAREHGKKARKVLPHIFTARGHNRRQFFAKDARAFLRWLDDELEPSVQSKAVPGGPAVLEHLKVRGACDRAPIREALNVIMPPIRSCFGERAGRIEVRFTVGQARAKAVNRASGGVSRDADACVLRAIRKATFPDKTSCRVVASWNRPVQPAAMTTLPSPKAMLEKPARLSPAALKALVPPAAQSDAPTPKR